MFRVESIDLSSPWAFVVVFLLALVDGVIPLVPARTALIALGVVAGTGDVRAYPLLALATAAAFVSDNVAYWIGARYWSRISRALFRGARSRRGWAWVEDRLRRHGTGLVALARVIPGGPTPITLTAGLVGIPKRSFRLAAACSAVLWSLYAFGMGMLGDAVTTDPLVALLVAVGIAACLNLAARGWVRYRRTRSAPGPPPGPGGSRTAVRSPPGATGP